MKKVCLVLPTQLFYDHPLLDQADCIVLVEHPRYFADFSFHPQKLVYHRATMRAWYDHMKAASYAVQYKNFADASTESLIAWCQQHHVSVIALLDPVDTPFMHGFKKALAHAKIALEIHPTPLFLSTMPELIERHGDQAFFMAPFYQRQRKALGILLDPSGKPVGGKWSFDEDNRKKMPDDVAIPQLPHLAHDDLVYLQQAEEYVRAHCEYGYGELAGSWLPVTRLSAEHWLQVFLKQRLLHFGTYQDAMRAGESLLFHSALTPMLNIGLLTPAYVIEKTLLYASRHSVPLNSLEGFIRQVIGWREYVRYVYELIGDKQRTTNFWHAQVAMPESFWLGTTGIAPLDDVIQKTLKTAYAHHIERLMVCGNFFQLCGIDPDQAYTWFMSLFIDAYDWVMVPNVYGMALYADGGMITTKPYISGSTYIRTMSNYKKGSWCEIWDALYWYFIVQHHDVIKQNARLGVMAMFLRRMKKDALDHHITCASHYIRNLS
jgi:deoxyribodipyrimidine photolyase-related protein